VNSRNEFLLLNLFLHQKFMDLNIKVLQTWNITANRCKRQKSRQARKNSRNGITDIHCPNHCTNHLRCGQHHVLRTRQTGSSQSPEPSSWNGDNPVCLTLCSVSRPN